MAGALKSDKSRDRGSGSNYLCLTENPIYKKYNKGLFKNTAQAQIGGVKYGTTFNADGEQYSKKHIACTVCEVWGKSQTLMVPATDTCPADWELNYKGYLSSQSSQTRTEYICLDTEIERTSSSSSTQNTGILDKVGIKKCDILPCGKDRYEVNKNLQCVVCSK